MALITLVAFGAIIVTLSMWMYGRLSPDEKKQFLESLDESVAQ